ncbi:restriction endonuclease [Proteiniclasticum sp. SCR006]|uniref:Restriction endonuclease n=1 Tax=Proteiniclasticum aestuarii TaxID=2817862 RepID=A0A939KIV1_9CLOT|nr:restriction endonuclease [Proteiniclasticum aestuarii]MBO1264376.1 restriction endonuclease [Proteiniclasticum aestuarii]
MFSFIRNIFQRAKVKPHNKYTLDFIDRLNGFQFEHAFADILKQNNFNNITVTQGSGDQGIDVLAQSGADIYAIQCKLYTGNVGNSAVQQAFSGAVYYGCTKAIVVTNSYFTKSAHALASQIGVELWDRDVLYSLIKNTQVSFANGSSNAQQVTDDDIIKDLLSNSNAIQLIANDELSTSYIQRKYRVGYNKATELKQKLKEYR